MPPKASEPFIGYDPLSPEELKNKGARKIRDIIYKGVSLHKRQEFIDRLLLGESIFFLILNSFNTLLGMSEIDKEIKTILLFIGFSAGIIASSMSSVVKWLQGRQKNTLDGYRKALKDIQQQMGPESDIIIIRHRLSLEAEVLADGFFRNITSH